MNVVCEKGEKVRKTVESIKNTRREGRNNIREQKWVQSWDRDGKNGEEK